MNIDTIVHRDHPDGSISDVVHRVDGLTITVQDAPSATRGPALHIGITDGHDAHVILDLTIRRGPSGDD
jgi:hypothetical protein